MSGQVTTAPDQPSDENTLSEEEKQILREAEDTSKNQEANPTELSVDRTFELLKNERRRRVLRYLLENGEASTTGELAEHVAALENSKEDVNAITSKERKAVYVGLYQCHLPKMDDYGVIEFNQARGRVELTELAYELEDYLYEPESTPPWPVIYLSVAVIGAATIGSSAILSMSGVMLVGTFVLVGLVLTVAIAQLLWERTD
jgi:hypothetical protein